MLNCVCLRIKLLSPRVCKSLVLRRNTKCFLGIALYYIISCGQQERDTGEGHGEQSALYSGFRE